jgi:hypothetical protein
MLVQVGAISPSLTPVPMTKFDLLLQQAEVHARRALIGTRERLRPLLHMIHADGKESVAGVPWGAGEKETTLALVRALMRAGDVVAYSILTGLGAPLRRKAGGRANPCRHRQAKGRIASKW